jgi:hypothetical protein
MPQNNRNFRPFSGCSVCFQYPRPQILPNIEIRKMGTRKTADNPSMATWNSAAGSDLGTHDRSRVARKPKPTDAEPFRVALPDEGDFRLRA